MSVEELLAPGFVVVLAVVVVLFVMVFVVLRWSFDEEGLIAAARAEAPDPSDADEATLDLAIDAYTSSLNRVMSTIENTERYAVVLPTAVVVVGGFALTQMSATGRTLDLAADFVLVGASAAAVLGVSQSVLCLLRYRVRPGPPAAALGRIGQSGERYRQHIVRELHIELSAAEQSVILKRKLLTWALISISVAAALLMLAWFIDIWQATPQA
jgi:hypothetical protein